VSDDDELTKAWYALQAKPALSVSASRVAGLNDRTAALANIAKEIEVVSTRIAHDTERLRTLRIDYEARLRWFQEVLAIVTKEAAGVWREEAIPGTEPTEREITKRLERMS
jgi:hypothetical protein